MHVSRVGLSALKGARRQSRPQVELNAAGPVGDRVFCLVDPTRERVVRTVENPSLLQARVGWQSGELTVTLAGDTVRGRPQPAGERRSLDYWGRRVELDLVDGPWAAAFSDHLGYEVLLARSAGAGVVYGASVSLITTGSLRELSRRVGCDVAEAQLRATFTVQTDEPHREDGWIGRRIRLGTAELEVRGDIPRCHVIDLDPASGTRRSAALRTLAGYRRQANGVMFGVGAVVTRPGRVQVGDPVTLPHAGG